MRTVGNWKLMSLIGMSISFFNFMFENTGWGKGGEMSTLNDFCPVYTATHNCLSISRVY